MTSIAEGSLIAPNGNPTGQSSVTSPVQPDGHVYTVSLNPCPAGTDTPVWVYDALSAQGFNAANGWTINTFAPAGTYRLDTYTAWAESFPTITEPTVSIQGENAEGRGG